MGHPFKHEIETKVPAHEKNAGYTPFLAMIEKRNISNREELKKYLREHQQDLELNLHKLEVTGTNNDERRKTAQSLELVKGWNKYLEYL